ncbi:MAG: DUF896 domain-containing protein [Firmicutes bacterium]|nr:DUF896 domain-containing protein [Bacillota bacterium]
MADIPASLIERINELARKNKTEGLTSEEMLERESLRRQYIKLFRQGFKQRLDNIYVVDKDGKERKLKDEK